MWHNIDKETAKRIMGLNSTKYWFEPITVGPFTERLISTTKQFLFGDRTVGTTQVEVIDKFFGEYRFLSNFYDSPFYYDGHLWKTVEHAYQAFKSKDSQVRADICKLKTAAEAKRAGKSLTIREDWEDAKLGYMKIFVRLKFMCNPDLKDMLLKTNFRQLIEGNTWGDTYWGVCKGVGENRLGRILMNVRDKLLHGEL